MVKFSTIGAFRNAVTFPNIRAQEGGVANFSLTVPDQVEKVTQLPTTTTAQGKNLAIIMQNFGTVVGHFSKVEDVLPEGETVLCVGLESVATLSLDIDSQRINGDFSTITKGTYLVADTDGKFAIVGSPAGYAIHFLVTDIIGPLASPLADSPGGVRAQIILA